jgi:hypothetical protein
MGYTVSLTGTVCQLQIICPSTKLCQSIGTVADLYRQQCNQRLIRGGEGLPGVVIIIMLPNQAIASTPSLGLCH